MVYPSSSVIRAFGSLLFRFSNGISLKPSNSFTFHRTCCLSRKLQSSSCYSSSGIWVSVYEFHSGNSNRKISTFPHLCMGRRSCKIAGGKKGGASPMSNTALTALFEKAKELDVPKEIIERNIKRASEKGQEAYIEKVYEVYGYGGVGIIVEVLTDKINRSVAAVREIMKDCGGEMADPESISFKFKRAWVVNVKVTDADRYQILSVALDAGADDVIELSVDEDDPEEEMNDGCFKIVSSSEIYPTILAKLREDGITFEPDNGFELLPLTAIEVDDEAMDLNKELMSKLLELDDLDAVYTDQK